MKKLMVTIAAMVMTLSIAAQGPQVGVSSNQNGNIVYFSVYNNTDTTVCLFPYIQERTNVTGSVVSMIQLGPNESGVNIGAFAQSNPNDAWSIQVGSKFHTGGCAE